MALALPIRGARLLVGRRPEGVHLAGFWEFPGGKVEAGERPEVAAARELKEEAGLIALELEPFLVFVHDYADRAIRFHVFLAPEPEGEPGTGPGGDWVWKSLPELRRLRMPSANARVLEALGQRVR